MIPEWEDYEYLVDNDFSAQLHLRNQLSDRKKEIEAQLKELNLEISTMLAVAGAKSVNCGNHMVTLNEHRGRTALNKEELKKGLIMRGVSASIVDRCFQDATSLGDPYTTLSVREKK